MDTTAVGKHGFVRLTFLSSDPTLPPETLWTVGLPAVANAWPAILAAATVVFVGFALHRRRVGRR